ncbi:toxin-antitoxin system YwqK family antitoxin [Ancylomarina longa]|uniref:Toxin-antitoxin system YwqK family antitoxin n=1 Tax=Ancylomarina longa TaxID=2487017 RepID=A0A434AF51_9BACT|nr:hypothetical protein [Ancylomarina longa]RUT73041.1 hypothetical protein DLK05_15325 [Ancylomarina longa]
MNRFFYPILTIILIFLSSCNLNVDGIKSFFNSRKEVGKKTEIVKKEVTTPKIKNGEVKYYYKSGKVKSIVNFKDNKKVGVSHTFYKTGEKQYEIPYVDGMKDGKVIWFYRSGKVYRTTEFRRGKKTGYQRKYYENGKLKSENFYKNSLLSTGLREISNTGKVKAVPHIVIQKINQLKTSQTYIVRLKLSNLSKKVTFYNGELIDGKFFPENGRGFMEIPSKKGVADIKFHINKGFQLNNTLHIIAVETTYYKNKRLLSKNIPISVRNPN